MSASNHKRINSENFINDFKLLCNTYQIRLVVRDEQIVCIPITPENRSFDKVKLPIVEK